MNLGTMSDAWNRTPEVLLRRENGCSIHLMAFNTRNKATVCPKNISCVVILGGMMTSQLQVLYAVVNNCFKDYLKHLHHEWLLRGKYALTPFGSFKNPNVTFITHMIIMP
jgi:hypothetical protein